MSKQVNRTVIGGFVLGAMALAVVAVMIFGKGGFFREKEVYVMFFSGSVKGLQVGAPVLLRGVRIGSVKKIDLDYYPDTDQVEIPVFAEFDPGTVHLMGKKKFEPGEVERNKILIDEGLRAQLEIQSLITGQLLVQLDFHPDTPVHLKGLYPQYLEIPTIPSTFQEIMNVFQDLPLKEAVEKLIKILDGVNSFVNSPDFQGLPSDAKHTIQDTLGLLQDINTRFGPLAEKVDKTLSHYDKLAQDVDVQIKPVLSDLRAAILKARDAMAQAEKTLGLKQGKSAEVADSIIGAADAIEKAAEATRPALANIKDLTSEDSATIYTLNTMLKEVAAAARSIRTLTDYLARHPEALISGKGGGKGR